LKRETSYKGEEPQVQGGSSTREEASQQRFGFLLERKRPQSSHRKKGSVRIAKKRIEGEKHAILREREEGGQGQEGWPWGESEKDCNNNLG